MPARQHTGTIEDLLRKKGLKVTPTRINILRLLKKRNSPQCFESVTRVMGKDCDPATIYRNLRDFARVGILATHLFGDKKTWYSLAPDNSSHSHYLRCKYCNHTVEIRHCDWHFLNSEIENTYNFKNVTHQLEFTGLCPKCQTLAKTTAK